MNPFRLSLVCFVLGALAAGGCGDLFETPNAAKATLSTHGDTSSTADGSAAAVPPGMVLIPSGKFMMGCVAGDADGKKYPWTLDKIDCSLAVWNDSAATSGKGCDHGGTLPAGTRPGNGYGVHDMAGNVWEWVADWYGDDYYAASPASSPAGPAFGANRVARGGGFADGEARNFRASARNSLFPTDGAADLGFRCARQP